MIKIGICDDEKPIITILKQKIELYIQKMNMEYDILTFLSGEGVLNSAEQLDVVFLDIEMNGLDGIETGKQLKVKNPDCAIIMATGNVNRYKDAFKINAFRYITKPFEDEEIEEALQTYFEGMVGTKTIEVYQNRIAYQIAERDICYVKAYNGYTLIMSNGMDYRSELSLREYEELLDARLFIKINRSYLVNVLHIKQNKDGEICVHGEEIKVSRRQKVELREKMMKADVRMR